MAKGRRWLLLLGGILVTGSQIFRAEAMVLPEKATVETMASLLAALANLCVAVAMIFLVSKLATLDFQGIRGRGASIDSSGAPIMGRQVSQTKEASELGPNAYEVSEEKKDGRKTVSTYLQSKTGESIMIQDSPDAIKNMKSVFMRLCQSSKEQISVGDVVKVHNLLGEPIDEDEEKQLMEFFKTNSKSTACITFDMFMRWWSELHDSSADPDQYYSNERYRQRFKVLHSRLKDPKLAQITAVKEGDVSSRRFRVWFECDGTRLSPWHDIPLRNADGSYNFVCEIPKWTRKKYEIATGEAMNPIKQDVKNGVLREYKWGDMLFNYGAFPQTWEDPKHVSEDTGCPGDNDPVDVIELGSRQRPIGSITAVKILGVIAKIDDDETDWKVLTIALDDDKAQNMHDLGDVDAHFPGMTSALTDWLRMYKTAEGKKENKFGFGGKPQGAAFARKIVDETHQSWRKLMAAADEKGKVKKVASGANLYTDLALGQIFRLFFGPGSAFIPRPGDWFCGSCQARNCRDRYFCWRCKPPSPITCPGTVKVLDSFNYPSRWDWGCTNCGAAMCGYQWRCSNCNAERPGTNWEPERT